MLNKEQINNIIYYYNEVGDYDMLRYIYKLELKDNKIKKMLLNLLELNDKYLDTPIYFEKRREFLDYLGFSYNDLGLLEYLEWS